jgi:hypothetical protein
MISILLVVTNSYSILYKELLVEPYNVKYFINYDENIKKYETYISDAKKIDLEKVKMITFFRQSSNKSYNENDNIIEKFRDLIAESEDKKGYAEIAKKNIDLYERYFAKVNRYVFKKEDIELLRDRFEFDSDEFKSYFKISKDLFIFKVKK